MKIYELQADLKNYSCFYEFCQTLEETFFHKYYGWQKIDLLKYVPIKLKLYQSDTGKKNFKTDINIVSGLIILSDRALEVLKPIFEGKGQFVEIETGSKRKKFFGFYPNNCGYELDMVNLEKTDWSQAEKGKLFYRFVFNNTYPKEEYLFTLKEALSTIFVTDKFKELVEKNNLKGFDFSREVEIID